MNELADLLDRIGMRDAEMWRAGHRKANTPVPGAGRPPLAVAA